MSKIIILVGCPASGKSTYARELHRKDKNCVIINRDDIRDARGTYWIPEQEGYISDIEEFSVRAALNRGLTPIIDATNLNPKSREKWDRIAHEMGAEVEVKEFDIPFEEALQRDYMRGVLGGRAVGEKCLRDFYSRYKGMDFTGYPAPVDYNHMDKRVIKEPNTSLPPCIICDLDGTLALHTSGRGPYEEKRCGEDSCDPRLAQLLDWTLDNGTDIIFLSGRGEACKEQSMEWIKSHLRNWRDQKISGFGERIQLLMRKKGDRRADQVVKKEIYDNHIKDKYNVLCVFDDRNKVVDMWRQEGLLCCQVYYGNF